MQPKTVFRGATNLRFDQFIRFRCHCFDRIAGGIDPIREYHPPTARPFGVNCGAEQCCTRPFGQKRREGRGRCEFFKKRHPQTLVSRMLIAQYSDGAALAKQFDCFLETFAPIEKFDSGASPQRAHMAVDVSIRQRLVNCAVTNEGGNRGKHLRLQLPIADVT